MDHAHQRTAREVLDDHLRQSKDGSLEDDLARNYAEDVVLLTGRGVYRGHDGVRELTRLLREQLPDAEFEYRTTLVEGEVAYLAWGARADGASVDDGADSYVIRNGRIVAQTIHYVVRRDSAPDERV